MQTSQIILKPVFSDGSLNNAVAIPYKPSQWRHRGTKKNKKSAVETALRGKISNHIRLLDETPDLTIYENIVFKYDWSFA